MNAIAASVLATLGGVRWDPSQEGAISSREGGNFGLVDTWSGSEGVFGRVRVGAVYEQKFRKKFAILRKFFFRR